MTAKKYVIAGGSGDGQSKDVTVEADAPQSLGGGQYTVRINGADRTVRILNMSSDKVEFTLDGSYHVARYVSRTTREFSLVVDGSVMTLGTYAELDKIVYKNSGGAAGGSAAGAQTALKSQIPGKVVSVSVSDGDTVRKGDVVCTLESMKMQVAIKAHKDGVIQSLRAKESVTFAKGDVIADIE